MVDRLDMVMGGVCILAVFLVGLVNGVDVGKQMGDAELTVGLPESPEALCQELGHRTGYTTGAGPADSHLFTVRCMTAEQTWTQYRYPGDFQ